MHSSSSALTTVREVISKDPSVELVLGWNPTFDEVVITKASARQRPGHRDRRSARRNATTWAIDPTQTPVFNRALRDSNADFFALLKAKQHERGPAFSQELVNRPDNTPSSVWALRHPYGWAFGLPSFDRAMPMPARRVLSEARVQRRSPETDLLHIVHCPVSDA